MPPLIKDAAREAAERALRNFWEPGRFPVDPALIALKMGLGVYEAELPRNTSGMIVKKANQHAKIYFSSRDVPTRQNFTCAHELGHYVERMIREAPDDDFEFIDHRKGVIDAHEFYANEFAGNLLMPAEDFRLMVLWGASDAELARRYGVSDDAIQVRKAKLSLDS